MYRYRLNGRDDPAGLRAAGTAPVGTGGWREARDAVEVLPGGVGAAGERAAGGERAAAAGRPTQPTMTPAHTSSPAGGRSLRAPVLWGVVFGGLQAASPLGFWWLDPATVYALGLVLIAAIYIGFAVADGRQRVIAVEIGVAAVFVVLAAAGVTGPAWLLVVGLAGHGFKDLWQHRRHFVANTRWWPPFCLVVDWVVAAVLVLLTATGVHFHP